MWSLWLAAGQTAKVIEQCIATTEPAALTKHAFQLAQQFNNFYHKHHILTRRGRGAEGSAAGYGGGGAERVDGDDDGDGDSGSGGDVGLGRVWNCRIRWEPCGQARLYAGTATLELL